MNGESERCMIMKEHLVNQESDQFEMWMGRTILKIEDKYPVK